MDLQAKIKDIQIRQKALASTRDKVIKELAVAEQKLEQEYEKLRALGVEDAEKLSEADIQNKIKEMELKLSDLVDDISSKLDQAETLLENSNVSS